MKTITRFLLAVVAVVAFSCTTDTTQDLGVGLGNNGGLTEITLSLEQSRTQLGEKAGDLYPLLWSEGDQISINGVASTALSADTAGEATATFSVAGTPAKPYCIAYPAAPAGQVLFADKQVHTSNATFASGVATMYAYAEDGFGVSLNHLTGVLKIGVVGSAKLVLAQISNANRKPIAGAFDFDFEKGEATATAASKEVINYSFGEGVQLSSEPTFIHAVVPAGEYGELYVTLYDEDGGVMYATVKADETKPLAAGKVREFSTNINYAATTSVFVVRDVASLRAFAAEANLSTKDVLFVADVDMTGEAWTPIEGYAGTVNGNGYAIKGLTAPLFGSVYCSIKGLHLVDVNIEETACPFVGALARHITSNIYSNTDGQLNDTSLVVENCSVSGKVVLNNQTAFVDSSLNDYGECVAAGLIGRIYGVDVTDCVNKATIEVKQCFPSGHTTSLYPSIGGVVGYVSYATQSGTGKKVSVFSDMTNLVNYGDVIVADFSRTLETNVTTYSPLKPYVGGIVGCAHQANNACEVHYITNYGDITLSGVLGNGVSISGTFGYIGTLNGSHIYNHGDITAKNLTLRYLYLGAGVGHCSSSTVLDNVHNYGAVTLEESTTCGSLVCGGLIAYQSSSTAYPGDGHGSISNSSNNGPVTVLCKTYPAELVTDNTALYYRVGGLAGWTQHYIDNCNNLEGGKVTCTGTLYHADTSNYTICVAGLVGYKTVNAIDNSRNDALIDVNLNMTTAEGYDLTKVRLNLGGISGYTNLPCRNVTNNGDVVFSGDLAGQLRIGGVLGQGASVSTAFPSYDKCVNNGNVTIKEGSTIGDQLMIGGVAAYINKNNECTNNGAVTIENNVTWGGLKTYIAGAVAYTYGNADKITNNGPLKIGDGCKTTSTFTDDTKLYTYIAGSLGLLYAAKATNMENTALGTVTVGKSTLDAITFVGGCLGDAPAVKEDGTTKLNDLIENCTNRAAITYGASCKINQAHYVGGCLGYVHEVGSKYYAAKANNVYNYGAVKVEGGEFYDLKIGGISAFLGGTTTNAYNYESGTIYFNATTRRYLHFAGVAQGIKDAATDIANYADMTIEGKIGHTLYGAGCITLNNNYTRTRNSNHGDITVNAEIAVNNFIGGLVYDSGANLTYIDCHNTGNFTLGEKAKVNTQTRWGGFVGKLEKNAKAGEEIFNIFDGCSNSGDIIIKGISSDTAYTAIGGIYGCATGNTQVIILNGFTNSGDIIFEGENNGVYKDDTSIGNRNAVNVGGLFGAVSSTIAFSNAANPSWTGDIINTGTIKFAGATKNAVQVGGLAGLLQGSTPIITDGKFINTGDIICTGTYDKSKPSNGVGGVAGVSGNIIDNAQVFCTIEAPSFPYAGMITGSERTDLTKVTNCAVGGKYLVEYDEEEDETIETKITSSNYYKYIYGKSVNWTGIENYDGNTYLSVSPVAPAN